MKPSKAARRSDDLQAVSDAWYFRRFLNVLGPVDWQGKKAEITAIVRKRFEQGQPLDPSATFSTLGPKAFSVSLEGITALSPENAPFDSFDDARSTLDELDQSGLLPANVGFVVAKHFITREAEAARILRMSLPAECQSPPLADALLGNSIRQVTRDGAFITNYYFENDFQAGDRTLHVVNISSIDAIPWLAARSQVLSAIDRLESDATKYVQSVWQAMTKRFNAFQKPHPDQ